MNASGKKTRIQDQQLKVSNPEASAWVSANAGSGKTTVLARRVIRLLLAGNAPAKILCLTFTKAAAANMANKVLGTLAEWVRLDDAALDKRLREVTPDEITPALRATARRLFTAALETPGGLKVQTIHAFCDRVLHQFPVEARVPAGFEVLDDVREADLLRRAREQVLTDASVKPESEIGTALMHAVSAVSDKSLNEALDEAVHARKKVNAMDATAMASLARSLGLEPGDSVESIEQKIIDGPNLPRSEWESIAATLQSLEGNAAKRGDEIAAAAAAKDQSAALTEYFCAFFTDKGTPRADSQFGGAAARDEEPALFERIFLERERLVGLRERWLAAQAYERTKALLTLAAAAIGYYENYKRGRGALDYSDLISRTAEMLADQASAWVHYKLDGGIDHVLIDEAQDTSPEQWKVIEKLTEEFFAGAGARSRINRTIFAVGDEKQSIFRFQGADPAQFDRMRRQFEQVIRSASNLFAFEEFELSFRSSPGVLAAVDQVFSRELAFMGISSAESIRTVHTAIRETAPALVEIWNPVKAAPDDENELAWDAPLNARSETSPPVQLARNIARAAEHWLAGNLAIEDRKTNEMRAPNAGDIIILVRRRGVLFDAILQALKQSGIPVAGADRLLLTEHIAVMDLIALGDVLLLNTDDLSLACVLKSPLFNVSEEELFELAHGRNGTLLASLSAKAETNEKFREIAERFYLWKAEALSLRPFDYYSRVLGRDRGREKMLARLGPEAADAIDEFLALALSYEQADTPSLAGFLHFIRRAGTEVKRDLEVESNAVRVMTVHGAKGLEAPVVVLADTTSLPDARLDPDLLSANGALVWAPSKKSDPQSLAAARAGEGEQRLAEYRRLLYVALTRAADALIICGHHSGRNSIELPENCWYRLVFDALSAAGDAPLVSTETDYGNVLRWRPQEIGKIARKPASALPPIKIPAALLRDAPASKGGVNRLRPSDFEDAPEKEAEEKSASRLNALKRGDLMHRLLQFLPELPEADRAAKAKTFLQSAATDFPETEREKLAAEAFALLAHPGMSALLGARSLPEVSFLAREPEKSAEIGGRIDRLFEKGNEIIIVDYKTDAIPPKAPEQVPERYQRQLALYREAVGRIYRGKTIRTLLVYSTGPQVHEFTS